MVRRKTLGKKIYTFQLLLQICLIRARKSFTSSDKKKRNPPSFRPRSVITPTPFSFVSKRKKKERTRVTRFFSQKCKLISIFLKC